MIAAIHIPPITWYKHWLLLGTLSLHVNLGVLTSSCFPCDPNSPTLFILGRSRFWEFTGRGLKIKVNISQYEINIQSELDFSSKSITRTLMFSFHIHFSLIYFVLFHVPKSWALRLRNVPACSGSTDGSEKLRHVREF